jgi:hypothetical protein
MTGALDQLDPADRMLLEIGPSPRAAASADWPTEEARLRGLWAVHRDELLAASSPGSPPWAVTFDEPGAEA